MNRSGCLSASAAVRASLIGRWLAAVLTRIGCAAAPMSGVVVLAGVSVVGARLRWLDGRTGKPPAGRTISLSQSEYEVVSHGANDPGQSKE